MRKHQQKQILDLIATLYEATDEINRQFFVGNIPTVINLLGDCQDVAIHIGEYIENLEGEDTQTVKLLTKYHESLYHTAMGIETANANFVKRLRRELSIIESTIRNELKPTKIEVAFFPYKASMWDALESIWLAAKEDPQCDAYVVPIPYFDRLPGGRVGQMHYEGHQYPDYVPIVDWQSYQLEAQRPDISFIHNGYDEYNMVTSVHPDYYSKNIKKYTEFLCYSPYFVVGNDIEPHGCTISGVLNADRVFVQSEKIRAEYINAIQSYEKEHNCVGRFGKVKDKIVASGSPKFDKVINSRPDDFTLPDKWKKLIENPDGSWKKIVLYNTSVGPILRGNEQYISKLHSVFNTFRNRDDVVLWWRPHPLSEATYDTMRPLLFDEYTRLIEEYRLEGYGIYDDTADLHRALSLSSAFYGDGSSLMQMYQCMRKPVMVQNEEPSESYPLIVGSLSDTEDYLWFLTLRVNGLYRLDKKTWNVKYMGDFVRGKAFDWRVYHSIHQGGNKLYFSPGSAEAIAVYDPMNCSFEYVELPMVSDKEYNIQGKFSKIIECNGSLYFIPLHYPGIIKLNMEDNGAEIIDDWVKSVLVMNYDTERGYFSSVVYDEERDQLVLAFTGANAVLVVDLKNNATKLMPLGSDKGGFLDIRLIDERYWLLALHRPALVSINVADSMIAEYRISLEGISEDVEGQFQKLFYSDNSLYLVPAEGQRLIRFNLAEHSFACVDEFDSADHSQNGYYYVSSDTADKIYVTERYSKQFIEYDPINGSLRKESLSVTEGLREFQNFLIRNQDINKLDNANSCAFWEHGASLENLLDMISQPVPESWLDKRLDKQVELRYAEIAHPDGEAGIEIYEHCKKAVLE